MTIRRQVIASVSACCIAYTAYAQPAPDEEVAGLEAAKVTLAEYIGADAAGVEAYIANIADAHALNNEILAQAGDTYGGLAITSTGSDFRASVMIAGDAQTELEKYTDDPRFSPVSVSVPLIQLISVSEQIGDLLGTAGIEFESGIDLQANRIRVGVKSPALVRPVLQAILDAQPVDLVEVSEFIQLSSDVYGGELAEGGIQNSTSGFTVRSTSTGQLGITTAGHQDNTGIKFDGDTMAMQAEVWEGSRDVQWHADPVGQDNYYAFVQISSGFLRIAETYPALVGEAVCLEGITSGYRCSTVRDPYAQIENNGQSTGYSVRVKRDDGTYSAQSGDSGGPYMAAQSNYMTGLGVVFGISGAGTTHPNSAYYTKVVDFRHIGVDIVLASKP